MNHFVVHQKLIQHCKSMILQFLNICIYLENIYLYIYKIKFVTWKKAIDIFSDFREKD